MHHDSHYVCYVITDTQFISIKQIYDAYFPIAIYCDNMLQQVDATNHNDQTKNTTGH